MLSSSVAICTYNGQRYFEAQFSSILDQSCQPAQIVVCDDGSTDGTLELIRSTIEQARLTHPQINIHFHQNKSNLGVTQNFAHAISLCTQDVIFLCDQDDVWQKDKIEQMLLPFEHDEQVLLAFHNAQMVDAALNLMGYDLWSGIGFTPQEQKLVAQDKGLEVLLRHAVMAGSCMAFRKSCTSHILPMPNLQHCHDMWIALLLTSMGKVVPVNQPLILYRLHGSNAVGMRKYSLLGQIRMARWQIKEGLFRYGADLHAFALDRLTQIETLSGQRLRLASALLQEKVKHFEMRDRLRPGVLGFPLRLWGILSHLMSGYYQKYSYGLKSVLQDLFLR